MILRTLQEQVRRAAAVMPVVTITGPRQSGKTTLSRMAFPKKPYANLERPDVQAFARTDPRGFLAGYPEGAVIDEVQRVPDLLSYIQVRVDENHRPGEFVLSGSQRFGLLASVTQSLAGRTAVFHLLPLGREEVERFPDPPEGLLESILRGGYPRIHDQALAPADWLPGYVATYVERYVRQVTNVGDLVAFQAFLALVAGNIGQLLNLSALGSACGISHNTAKAWLSILETSYIAFRLPPLHRNLKKRLTRRPKLYFHDTGLACWLLGITTVEQLDLHPLRGALFECWVVSEVMKARLHRGLLERLFFYRDHKGQEVDLVVDTGSVLLAAEMKSGKTVASDAFRSLSAFAHLAKERIPETPLVDRVLVYGGEERQARTNGTVLPWSAVAGFGWAPETDPPSIGNRPRAEG